MSKVTIAGDVNGTGVFTISAPNGNTNRTLVLPDEAGTVLTSAGVPSSAMPAGSVLQVVSHDSGTQTLSFGSGTWVDTAFSLTITPASASNKILLSFTTMGLASNTLYLGIRILRDSTTVAKHWSYHNQNTAYDNSVNFAINGVDSPAASTAVTYKIQIFSTQNTGQFYFNYNGADNTHVAHFIAMEVAA
jgi:hypothetical protein